jgi:hypothetical protein
MTFVRNSDVISTDLRLSDNEPIDIGDLDEKIDCKICLYPVEEAITTVCQHTFCRLCLRTWLRDNDTCPICRRDLSKAPADYFGMSNGVTGESQVVFDRPPIHAATTLGQSVRREAIQQRSPVLNTPQTQIMRVPNVPASASSDSLCHTLGHLLSGGTSANGYVSANENGDQDQIPITSFSLPATRQIPTSKLPRASNDHDPTEHQPSSRKEFDIGHHDANELAADDLEGKGSSITINPRRLLGAMRSRANEEAHVRGISRYPDYSQAAKVVYRQWARTLKRKAGQTVPKYELMWLLAEEMNLALADAGVVDFNGGEVLPRRLSRYLCDVARVAVDA